MKTFKNLWPHLCSFENLYRAWRKARRGKSKKAQVIRFEADLEDNLLQLLDELESGAYQPGDYTNFYIYEAKRRKISAAPFRDRVVHHALCRVLEPIYERRSASASSPGGTTECSLAAQAPGFGRPMVFSPSGATR